MIGFGIRSRSFPALFLLLFSLVFTHNAFSQSVGQGVVVSNVNDWGSGYNVTFEYEITAADVADDLVRDWRIEIDYSGAGQIANPYMTGYSGSILSGYVAPDGGFAITNEGVGYRPELDAGFKLIFTLQGQGAGFDANNFAIEFINLTKLPTNEFQSSLVNVNDWYNPSWGGGFNATFRCDVLGPDARIGPVTDLLIEFNYTGSGTPSTAWTQSHNGPIEHGFIAPDGGYAIQNLNGFQPELYAGDSITFAIQVQNAGFNESDFDIQCSSGGETDANTAPLAIDQALLVESAQPLAIALTGSDPDGDEITFSILQLPLHGTLTGTAPDLIYLSGPDYSGSDQFTFSVSDGLLVSTGVVDLDVTTPMAELIAVAQNLLVDEDTALTVLLAATGGSGGERVYTVTSEPLNGVITGTAPNLLYTPSLNFSGSDSFAFQVGEGDSVSESAEVSIDVLAVNDAPMAGEVTLTTSENTAIATTLSGEDVDGDTLEFQIVSTPSFGTLSGTAPNLIYTPNDQYNGADSFEYTVSDGIADSAIATVSLTISAVNSVPVAADISVATAEDQSIEITLSGDDPDGDALIYSVTTQPTNGTLTGAGSILIYQPDANYSGDDAFSYTVSDDESTSTTATVSISVADQNDAPVAVNSTVTIFEDTPNIFPLVGTDAEQSLLTFSVIDEPVNGSYELVDGEVSYTPAENFFGDDQLTFIVSDGELTSEAATVLLTIEAVNDAPVTSDLEFALEDNETVSFSLLAIDEDNDELSFTLESIPLEGDIDGIAPDLTYTPLSGFSGTIVLSFSVTDGELTSEFGTITFIVSKSNSPPVISSFVMTTFSDASVSEVILVSDEENDEISLRIEVEPINGTAQIVDGSLFYTPAQGYTGSDSLVVVANDGTSDSEGFEVVITISSEPQAPEISTIAISSVVEPGPYLYDVDATDLDSEDLTYSLVSAPTGATIDPATGYIEWTPASSLIPGSTESNQACLATQLSSGSEPVAELVTIMDESGSMGGEQEWIGDVIPFLDVHLLASGVGNDIDNRYGLVGYGDSNVVPRKVGIGELDDYYGSPSEFKTATADLETSGGTEDGWSAIDFALENYPLNANATKSFLLITDEDRDNTDSSITYETVLEKLQSNNASLDVIVPVEFSCADGTLAIGILDSNTGVTVTSTGGFELCEISSLGSGSIKTQYIDMALESGGTAWNLDELRAGDESADIFSEVFSRYYARSVASRLEEIPQSDAVIVSETLSETAMSVELKNRGLSDIVDPMTVEIVDATGVVGSVVYTDGLIANASIVLELPISQQPTTSYSVIVRPDSNITECYTNNNALERSYFDVLVTDETDLTDNQNFFVGIENSNDAPELAPITEQVARAGTPYNYIVQASDRDLGEGLIFSLTQAPAGMTINQYTGELSYYPEAGVSGLFSVIVDVTDTGGFVASESFQISVVDDYIEPKFINVPTNAQIAAVTELFSYEPTVVFDESATLTFSLFNAPDGLEMNSNTGGISWTPPESGINRLHAPIIMVADQFGNYDLLRVRIAVDNINEPPVIEHRPATVVTANGRSHNQGFFVSDSNVFDELTYELTSIAEGLSISDSFSLGWRSGLVDSSAKGKISTQDSFCGLPDSYTSRFDMTTQWAATSYGGSQPLVGPLYDSNGDGVLTAADKTFVTATEPLNRQLSMRDATTGQIVWQIKDSDLQIYSTALFTDVNDDAKAELIYLLLDGRLRARDNTGEILWHSDAPVATSAGRGGTIRAFDMDGDGDLEIFYGPSVFDHDGKLLWQFPISETFNSGNNAGDVLVADINNDGDIEVLYDNQVRTTDGNLLYTLGQSVNETYTISESYFAIADVNGDGVAELVVSESTNRGYYFRLLDSKNNVLWETRVDEYGPLVVGEFSSNPGLEIYSRSLGGLYDQNGDLVWKDVTNPTIRRSATAVDIDGDGYLNVLTYGSGELYIFSGETGVPILEKSWFNDSSYVLASVPILVDIAELGGSTLFLGGSGRIAAFTPTTGTWGEQINSYAFQGHGFEGNVYSGVAGPVASSPEVAPLGSGDLMVEWVRAHPAGDADKPYSGTTVEGNIINRGVALSSAYTVKVYKDSALDEANLVLETRYDPLDVLAEQKVLVTLTDAALMGDELYMTVVSDVASNDCFSENNVASAPVALISATDIGGLSDSDSWAIGVVEEQEKPVFNSTDPVFDPTTTRITITEGELFELTYEVEDPNVTDRAVVSFDRAPQGFTVNETTRTISWRPEFGQAGTHAVYTLARDLSYGSSSSLYIIFTVLPAGANTPPQITSTPVTANLPVLEYRYLIVASDTENERLTYSLDSGPVGMVVDQYTGELIWETPIQGDHLVTVRVTDQRGEFSTQDFTLNFPSNIAPVISSTPSAAVVVVGSVYDYQIVANDPEGDPLTYTLVQAPEGANLSADGEFLFMATPAQLGDNPVEIRVLDLEGLGASQSFNIVVIEPTVANEPPAISSIPENIALIGQLYTYQISATDTDGDVLTYFLQTGPTGMQVDAMTGFVSWTPLESDQGAVTISLVVDDGKGGTAVQFYSLQVSDDATSNSSPSITSTPGSQVYINELFSYQIQATDAENEPLTFAIESGPATATFSAAGLLEWTPTDTAVLNQAFQVSVSDGTTTVLQDFTVSVLFDPIVGADPVLEISSPEHLSTVTNIVSVTGTVTDPNLSSWRLIAQRNGTTELLELASGTTEKTNEVLGQFDPTLLINGQYTIAVQAFDTAGNESLDGIVVIVDGDLKVGNFTITFNDLSIPMVGIPIEVNRTYDSRRRAENLDFGYGWTIDYQNVEVTESRTLGLGWEYVENTEGVIFGDPPEFCVQPLGTPTVTVRLPDDTLEEFDVALEEACHLLPVLDGRIVFKPRSGTTSELTSLDNTLGRINVATGEFGPLGGSGPIDPNRYELTTKAGYVYVLNQSFGIETITDPNGHVLTYSDTGISHSAGKSIDFIRDATGRITEITDPSGNTITYNYDAANDLVAVTDREFATTDFTYNNNHGLVDIIDPLGRRIVRNIYDDDGRLTGQEDNEGNVTNFNHNLSGRESIITDRLGRITALYYDERGNVTSKVDALGRTYTYTYDEFDNQLTETDPLGHSTSATFDDRYNQLSQTDGLGNTVTYAYNRLGQETLITDARGNSFNNTYDSVGNLLTVTDPLGNVAGQNINSKGLVSLRRDAENNDTLFEYDDEGNVTKETDAEGGITTYTYDDNNNRLTESRTRTVNNVATIDTTAYEYNSRDQQTKTTDALGNVTQTEYDALGREVAQIDAKGRRTTMVYDNYGRLTATTYPDGTSDSSTYDLEGNKLTDTNRLGRTMTYTIDALNRVVSTLYPDNVSTSSVYDEAGRMVSETDERGNTRTQTYDAANRRIASVDALGNTMGYGYDVDGNMTTQTDARSNTTTYAFNALDQRVLTTFADSTTMSSAFDKRGLEVSKTDQNGRATGFDYDGLGRLISVTDALNQVTQYGYDEVGNKLAQTDALGRVTGWAYDAINRPVSRTLPLGQQETYAYDTVGNRTSHTDFNGATHAFVYDPNNDWLLNENWANGNSTSYAYNAIGQRTSATDANGTFIYDYDNRDRLTSEIKHDGSELIYGYDAAGNRTTLSTVVAGATNTATYTFDALNRMASVTDNDGNTTSYTFDANSNQTRIDQANNTATTMVFDDLNRVTTITHLGTAGETLTSLTYSLDDTGRRTAINESSGRSSNYTYDELYRLTGEAITDNEVGSHSASYEYNAVSNRIADTVNGTSSNYTYDDNDRLTDHGLDSYSYDDNGNTMSEVLNGQTNSYTYDSQNRLIEANMGGVVQAMAYDPDGVRIQKSTNGNTTDYLTDSNRDYAQVLYERSATSELNYTFGTDLVGLSTGVENFSYHTDALGSMRLLTNGEGNVADDVRYDAWGEVLSGGDVVENQYLYTGEQFDGGLGKTYLRARYYDAGVGRFSQMDVFSGFPRNAITLNKYLYGDAQPTNMIDPSGQFSLMSLGVGSRVLSATLSSVGSSGIGAIASNAAVRGTIRLGGRIATKYVSKYIKKCLKKKDKCGLSMNLLIVGFDRPDMLSHIRDAQLSRPRTIRLKYKDRPPGNQWYKNKGGCAASLRPSGLYDCDEYPMNRTKQGGKGNFQNVSLRWVHRSQNRSIGSFYGHLIKGMKKSKKFNFYVITTHSLPSAQYAYSKKKK